MSKSSEELKKRFMQAGYPDHIAQKLADKKAVDTPEKEPVKKEKKADKPKPDKGIPKKKK